MDAAACHASSTISDTVFVQIFCHSATVFEAYGEKHAALSWSEEAVSCLAVKHTQISGTNTFIVQGGEGRIGSPWRFLLCQPEKKLSSEN